MSGTKFDRMQVSELLEVLGEQHGITTEVLARWTETPIDEVRGWHKEAPTIVREMLRALLAYLLVGHRQTLDVMTFAQTLGQGFLSVEQLGNTQGVELR